MAKDGISFFDVERVAIGPGSPALQGWSRVTREIVSSPLYRVAADIATRAGITEGLILAPEHEDKRNQVPSDRSLMSVTQAANTLGISRAAVHKAIQEKRLAAQRCGNVILVGRDIVQKYEFADARHPGIQGPAEALREPIDLFASGYFPLSTLRVVPDPRHDDHLVRCHRDALE